MEKMVLHQLGKRNVIAQRGTAARDSQYTEAGGERTVSITAIRPGTGLLPAPPDEGIHRRRWTRDEYYHAADLGLFPPEERLELLDGEIIRKMTQKPPHAVALGQAADVLALTFGPGHHVRTQLPLTLSDWSEPEPDVGVVPGIRSDFLSEHPKATHSLLVVEVSDTTLRFDRSRKRRAYARSGVQEYWIVNLVHRQLEVFRDPVGLRYRSITAYGAQETLAPLAVPHASVRVSDLLPRLADGGTG
jgi:Uma2 family endonuclease